MICRRQREKAVGTDAKGRGCANAKTLFVGDNTEVHDRPRRIYRTLRWIKFDPENLPLLQRYPLHSTPVYSATPISRPRELRCSCSLPVLCSSSSLFAKVAFERISYCLKGERESIERRAPEAVDAERCSCSLSAALSTPSFLSLIPYQL